MHRLPSLVRCSPWLVLVACVSVGSAAFALPLQSREDGVSCTDCHFAPPRLNARGMEFLRSGGVETAAGPLWAAHPPPVSVGVSSGYEIADENPERRAAMAAGDASRGAVVPGTISVHVAGALLPRLTLRYTGEYRTGTGAYATERAFLRAGDLLKRGALNLRAGFFDIESPFLSQSRRTTIVPYLAPVALEAAGLEANGGLGAWTWSAGRAESHRKRTGDEPPSRFLGQFEDTYFSVMCGVGEQRLAARMLFDRQDSNLSRLAWLQHLQVEGSALATVGGVSIVPAYVFDRFDDRPAAGMHERHQYALLEVFAPFGPGRSFDLTARAEHEYVTANAITREMDRNVEVVSCGYRPLPGLRFAAEDSRSGDNVGGPRVHALHLSVGVVL